MPFDYHKIALHYIISIVVFFFSGCHESPQRKTIEGKNFDKSSNTGLVTKYHENGKVSTIIKYVNGEKHGLAKSFYSNGNLKAMVNYEYNVKQGEARMYYEKGGLYRTSVYYEGELDGIRKKYRPNGDLMSEIPYLYGWPGIGLKEYTVSGKLKRNYPKLIVEKVYDPADENISFLKVYFSDKNEKVEFFLGQLVNDRYLHRRLTDIQSTGGVGKINVKNLRPPGEDLQLNIVGKLKTRLKNPYIVQRQVSIP